MSDGPFPKTFKEAVPYVTWGAVIFTFAFVFVEKLSEKDYGTALFALIGGLTVIAVALHSKEWLEHTHPNWIVLAILMLLAAVILSPFVEQHRWPFTVIVERETAEVTAKPPDAVKTVLRLQFYGDSRVPTEVGASENIYHWFALYSAQIGVSFRDQNGNEVAPPGGLPRYGPTWDVFVVLKQPTTRRQIVTSFSNPEKMGPSQIMGETDRSFIFHSMKEMPAGVLEIKAEQ